MLMENKKREILESIRKSSEEGVLLYKTDKPERPATWDQIARAISVREDASYSLEFIVKDEEGNLKEMWFGDEKGKRKGKKTRGR